MANVLEENGCSVVISIPEVLERMQMARFSGPAGRPQGRKGCEGKWARYGYEVFRFPRKIFRFAKNWKFCIHLTFAESILLHLSHSPENTFFLAWSSPPPPPPRPGWTPLHRKVPNLANLVWSGKRKPFWPFHSYFSQLFFFYFTFFFLLIKI